MVKELDITKGKYSVSGSGEIINTKTGRRLKPKLHDGYYRVGYISTENKSIIPFIDSYYLHLSQLIILKIL